MNYVTWFIKYSYGGGKSSSKEKTVVKIPLLLAISFKSCVIIHSHIRSFSHYFPRFKIHVIIHQTIKKYLRVSPDRFKSSLSKSACIFAKLRIAENCSISNLYVEDKSHSAKQYCIDSSVWYHAVVVQVLVSMIQKESSKFFIFHMVHMIWTILYDF